MDIETNYLELREMAHETRREVEHRRDECVAKAEQMEGYLKVLEATEKLMAENERLREENKGLREENEGLQQQLAEEKQQRMEMETRMNEMSKLSAGVARKASQDDLFKALRIFLNTSKRKTMSKREAAKTVITDMLTSAKIELPDDVLELLDHLDDEQTEPKVVNVQGNYNDIHNNSTVNQK